MTKLCHELGGPLTVEYCLVNFVNIYLQAAAQYATGAIMQLLEKTRVVQS